MINRGILLLILLVCCSFQSNELKGLLVALQNNIQKSIRISPEANPAKTKLEVNQAGFIRFTQTLKSGKQNYASLNLYKFSKMNYWGTAKVGTLILYSVKNEVIVQTFNDPAGDVDSMSTHLNIPIQNIEPEQLDAMDYQLRRIRFLLLQKSK